MFDYVITLLKQLKTAWERRAAEKERIRKAAIEDDAQLREAVKGVKK